MSDADAGSQRTPLTRGWGDLTPNKGGEAARKRERELWHAERERGFWGRFRARPATRSWRVGADGEEAVAQRLDRLPDGWCVLHAIPVGDRGTDIDHLVIGPGGVFTLNTKNHSASNVWVAQHAFMVNGKKTDYLRNSRSEAKRATKLLSNACGFPVNAAPVIVVIAKTMKVKARPEGVAVVSRADIVDWLVRRPRLLSPDSIDKVFAQARRDITWRSLPRTSR